MPFGDRGALMRGNSKVWALCPVGMRVTEEEPAQDVWDVWAGWGGSRHRPLFCVPSSPVPTVSQGSGESSRRVMTVRNNQLTYCTSPDAN